MATVLAIVHLFRPKNHLSLKFKQLCEICRVLGASREGVAWWKRPWRCFQIKSDKASRGGPWGCFQAKPDRASRRGPWGWCLQTKSDRASRRAPWGVPANQVRQGFKERTLGVVPASQVRQGFREKTLGGCFQAKSDKGSGKGP